MTSLLNALTTHTLDLLLNADTWTETQQDTLRHFCTHVESLRVLLLPPRSRPADVQAGLEDVWSDLAALERLDWDEAVVWHLPVLRETLTGISKLVPVNAPSMIQMARAS